MRNITKKLKKIYFNLHTIHNKYSVTKSCRGKIKKVSKKNILTNNQKKEIKNYFKKYKKVTTNFHNFYLEKTGNFHVNYLPDDFYYCDIDMFYNDWNVATTLDNKCFYKDIFRNIKQPDTVIMRVNGIWYNKNMNILTYDNAINELTKEKEVFIKEAVESSGGKGVAYFKIENKSVKKKFENVIKDIKVDIIVQKALKQHKTLSKINESSVNTIRILSLLTNNGVKIYSSILRMGINGSKVDNASSGGITCGINDDGTLKNCAYTAVGEKFDKHPTSGIHFETITIPKFSEMKELIKQTHPLIPHFRLVSWDIAVNDKEEIILIEANLKFGELDFHQLNNGPVFGEDTQKILDEVFNKNK